jgi:valyl-tRNA synthetase
MIWRPEKQKQRLLDWANGLDWNWVISRQRVFGTPIPFWYCAECGEIITPSKEDLPLDPVTTPPPVNECPKCKNTKLIGEKDVCDCWIDSSITPLEIAKWEEETGEKNFYERAYLKAKVHRPQGYEIIRTWLFYTLFRCKKLTGKDPFYDEIMPLYGADAIRQWAAMGSLGDDYPFEFSWINLQTKQPIPNSVIMEEKIKLPEVKFNKKFGIRCDQLVGTSRFITKIWNAYRFLFMNLNKIDIPNLNIKAKELSPIDCFYYSEFNNHLEIISGYYDEYNWHGATLSLRSFFWNDLCDNYIEAIKHKFYSNDHRIREISLKNALDLFYKVLILSAVTMPFISEEINSIIYKNFTNLKSIHQERWPDQYPEVSEDLANIGKTGIELIKFLRMNKSKLQIPLNQEIPRVIIISERNQLKNISKLSNDIKNTIRIDKLDIIEISEESKIKDVPLFKENIKDLGIAIYIYNS